MNVIECISEGVSWLNPDCRPRHRPAWSYKIYIQSHLNITNGYFKLCFSKIQWMKFLLAGILVIIRNKYDVTIYFDNYTRKYLVFFR